PRSISRLISSTALTCAAIFEKTPRRIGKYFFRFRTLSSGCWSSGMDAANLVMFTGRLQRNFTLRAFFGALEATRLKRTTERQLEKVRHHPIDRIEAVLMARTQPRYRLEQTLGVWMFCIVENFHRRSHFDDLPRVHDGYRVCNFGDHSEIMGNENDGQV